MTEIEQPLCVRRHAAFAEALHESSVTVEGVEARRTTLEEIRDGAPAAGGVAVIAAPDIESVLELAPDVLIDARMLKTNPDTRIDQAAIVGALGPGYEAGRDCHFVVETCRGHDLGRVIERGTAMADTGRPATRGGASIDRVLYSRCAGRVEPRAPIGARVQPGDVILEIAGVPHETKIAGVVRGVLREGTAVDERIKVADVDPLGTPEQCRTISDRANAIAGGVLEGVLSTWRRIEA